MPHELIFHVGGMQFFIIPGCVQYVAVRPPPGPRSAGFNPAAAGGSPLCQITAEGKA